MLDGLDLFIIALLCDRRIVIRHLEMAALCSDAALY